MDVKPWQRKGNQYEVRPFKFVLKTGRKWQISVEHNILTEEKEKKQLGDFCLAATQKARRNNKIFTFASDFDT